jgi:hypothetical protein
MPVCSTIAPMPMFPIPAEEQASYKQLLIFDLSLNLSPLP